MLKTKTCRPHQEIIYKRWYSTFLQPRYSKSKSTEDLPSKKAINKTISYFNCTKAFENLSVDETVEALNETLLNIYRNYIPNKKIKCNYCQPSWMTDNIKKSLKERSKLTEKFYKNGQRKTDR